MELCVCGHTVTWHGGPDDEDDLWPCQQCDCEAFCENEAEPLFDLDNDQ